MTVNIMQIAIKNMNPNLSDCIFSIDQYESFEEYLNLMAVERIKIPITYKTSHRRYNVEKQEVLAEIYDIINNKSYTLFAKVI